MGIFQVASLGVWPLAPWILHRAGCCVTGGNQRAHCQSRDSPASQLWSHFADCWETDVTNLAA